MRHVPEIPACAGMTKKSGDDKKKRGWQTKGAGMAIKSQNNPLRIEKAQLILITSDNQL